MEEDLISKKIMVLYRTMKAKYKYGLFERFPRQRNNNENFKKLIKTQLKPDQTKSPTATKYFVKLRTS